MGIMEWSKIRHNSEFDVGLFHAYYTSHAYPRHSHDYYVIGLIDQGVQSFTFQGAKYITPAGGLILLNPGDVHTGEPADEEGFEYRAIYVPAEHMQAALSQFGGKHSNIPFFPEVRIDHPCMADGVRGLHQVMMDEASSLERESKLLRVLTSLIGYHSDARPVERKPGRERKAVREACRYIEAFFTQNITLAEIAAGAGLSPYYFLRVFRNEVGMPPHAYLETVRIRQAQRALAQGMSIVDVSYETGFSSQSHFANRFKLLIGVTPGQYIRRRNTGKGRAGRIKPSMAPCNRVTS